MPIPPEAAELANQANSVFVDEDYDNALDLYSQAVAVAPACADLYVARAQVHLKKDDFTSAFIDANKAIELEPSNSKAYFRKGVACFSMEEYSTAKVAFEKGFEFDPKNAQFKTWIRKCNAEIDEEMASEVPAPVISTPAPVPAAAATLPPAPKPVARFRHDFIQTPTHVTVSFYMKGATKENCQVDFEDSAFALDWTISSTDSWQVTFDPLFDAIVPDECTVSCFATKVEVKLKKKNAGKWDSLESKNEKALDELTEEEIKRKRDYYPSSKSQGGAAKNWDKIVHELPQDKLEGEEALNDFFQQIYGRGDPEIRRAMNKSFVESGGTVLSTNWTDVGSKTVEGTPPAGLEMKKWTDVNK